MMIVYKCIYLKSAKYVNDLLTNRIESITSRLTAKYFVTMSSGWLDMARDLLGIRQLHYGMVYL